MKKICYFIAVSFIFVFLVTTIGISKQIPPKEDFLSLVRYIITDEEVNMYKEYPPSEREEFVEKFWARRDPTPTTPKNELMEHYFQRIEESNKLFKGGIAGWLQDRGRIYILLGPPDERIVNPGGSPQIDPFQPAQQQLSTPMDKKQSSSERMGDKPSETWIYYKLLASSQIIKIDFVDAYATGNLKLVTDINQLAPGMLSQFLNPSLSLIHELSKQELNVKEEQALLVKRLLFNFQWEFKKEKDKEKNSNLMINIELPIDRIIFLEEENMLVANMDLFIEIRDTKKVLLWDHNNTYSLSFAPDQLEAKKDSKWILKVPVTHWLEKGKYSAYIHLTNLSGNQDVKKLLQLKM
jgi:GWxTD domain-containing protein